MVVVVGGREKCQQAGSSSSMGIVVEKGETEVEGIITSSPRA